jgi:hypothetical protein
MITSLVALAVASALFLLFAQTRWVGAIIAVVLIYLNPWVFLVTVLMGGTVYYLFKQ